MKLLAKKQFLFGKNVLEINQPFETNDAHAKDLIRLGQAVEQKAETEKTEETGRKRAAK